MQLGTDTKHPAVPGVCASPAAMSVGKIFVVEHLYEPAALSVVSVSVKHLASVRFSVL